MTLADPKPGGWSLAEVLTAAQLNAVRSALLNAVDGVGGGTYALTSPLIFTTDVVRLDTDDIDVVSGGELSILSGGTLSVESGGVSQLEGGAVLDVLSTASIDVASGGDINIAAGGEIHVIGDIAVDAFGELFINASGSLYVTPSGQQLNDGLVQFNSGSSLDLLSGSTTTISDLGDVVVDAQSVTVQWDGVALFAENWGVLTTGTFRQTSVAAAYSVFVAISPKNGDDLSQIRVRLDGGSGAGHGGSLPATMPTIELFRRNPETGAATSIAGPTTDASASAAAYDVPHDVTLSAIGETANGHPYFLEISGETGANSVANTLNICGVETTHTARSVRATQEVG